MRRSALPPSRNGRPLIIAGRQRYTSFQPFKFDARASPGSQQPVCRLAQLGAGFRRIPVQCGVEGCEKRRYIGLYPLTQSNIDECSAFVIVGALVDEISVRAIPGRLHPAVHCIIDPNPVLVVRRGIRHYRWVGYNGFARAVIALLCCGVRLMTISLRRVQGSRRTMISACPVGRLERAPVMDILTFSVILF